MDLEPRVLGPRKNIFKNPCLALEKIYFKNPRLVGHWKKNWIKIQVWLVLEKKFEIKNPRLTSPGIIFFFKSTSEWSWKKILFLESTSDWFWKNYYFKNPCPTGPGKNIILKVHVRVFLEKYYFKNTGLIGSGKKYYFKNSLVLKIFFFQNPKLVRPSKNIFENSTSENENAHPNDLKNIIYKIHVRLIIEKYSLKNLRLTGPEKNIILKIYVWVVLKKILFKNQRQSGPGKILFKNTGLVGSGKNINI